MSNITERVRKVLASKFDLAKDDLAPEMTFREGLGADSVDAVEIAMAFEKEFGIEISDDVIETITTIGDAERFVTKTLHDKG